MRQWWKEHGRKWAFRLCGLALAAAVAVSLLPETVVLPASAVTQAEIDAIMTLLRDYLKESTPWPPAVWTQPEPLSSVTWSPRMTQPS